MFPAACALLFVRLEIFVLKRGSLSGEITVRIAWPVSAAALRKRLNMGGAAGERLAIIFRKNSDFAGGHETSFIF